MSQAGDGPLFSPDEARTLAAALDLVIPPGAAGRMPGAGELGLAAHFEELARAKPELGAALRPALAALDERARDDAGTAFAELAPRERRAVLEAVAADAPALLPSLVGPTYVAYYQDPRVLEALGLEARPPFPMGYEVAPDDPSLLDPVRAREPFYRVP